jgi:hypothetical protein
VQETNDKIRQWIELGGQVTDHSRSGAETQKGDCRMWAPHQSEWWPDLDAREERTSWAGSALYVGGFVLSDSSERIFRAIGADYIRDAWRHLGDVLNRHEMRADDLSWGLMHPGVTALEDQAQRWRDPCRWLGWTSCDLYGFDANPRWKALDAELSAQSPQLRCAMTWRSHRWRISGDEIGLGLRLFEAVGLDDLTVWNPSFIFEVPRDESEPWICAAAAIRDDDQQRLDQSLAEAERTYTAIGYRIVVLGFHGYASAWAPALRFPSLPEPVPSDFSIDLTPGPPANVATAERRSGWWWWQRD